LIRVDLEFCWSRRNAATIEQYLQKFPQLSVRSADLQAICFEEYRQRVQAGETPRASEYESGYGVSTVNWPQLRPPVSGTGSSNASNSGPPFPQVGEQFLGFQLKRELGRGAFACVYLAEQAELSARPVALKICRARFSDAHTLARLQHTNIVPIYSVHEADIFEAVCMPYFGSHTLADLCRSVRQQPILPASGRFILDTITAANQLTEREPADAAKLAPTPDKIAEKQLPNGFLQLAGCDYVAAVLCIMKKVALALAHAHERGIIHRDLKPANILLADDGEPMLLDFNLAEDRLEKQATNRDFIGGTLPYMPPEQLLAFAQRQTHSDARGDLFSLGVLMYEMLTGQQPYPVRTGKLADVIPQSVQDRQILPSSLRTINSSISPAVAAIVLKCLAVAPEDRYQSAQDLAEDIERQLNHLPLRHIPEPSLHERAQKWVRRHPRLVSGSALLFMAGCVIAMLCSLLVFRNHQFAKLEAQQTWQAFQSDLQQTRVQLTSVGLDSSSSLQQTLDQAEHALAHFNLHLPVAKRSSTQEQHLDASLRTKLREDAAELHFLIALALTQQADFTSEHHVQQEHWQQALRHNQEALELIAQEQVPAAFKQQRLWLEEKLNIATSNAIATAPTQQGTSTRDLCHLANWHLSQRRFADAAPLWQQASRQSPDNIWVWYGLGYCLEQQGELSQAAECYTACIALHPQQFDWYFQRGRLRMLQHQYALAREDFHTALKIKPVHAETYLNLAITQIELQDYAAATRAALRAIQQGYADPRVHSILAQSYAAVGDETTAALERNKAQALDPLTADSWVARGASLAKSAPDQAMTAFDAALSLNAHCLPALESKAHVQAELLRSPHQAIETLNQAVLYFPNTAALRASRGVLHARAKQRENALKDAEKALIMDRSPAMLYQVGCIHALLADSSSADCSRALELLAAALQHGYGSQLLEQDADLDLIRAHSEFQQLLTAARTIQGKAKQP
jgi:serine/threonine protein kinase/Flp pilus assembly protein TadD